ncbi:ROK family protein [Paenibacillus montanisoli]|nr:ROK family protein [Paenibacillus montanisoli]
MGEVIGIDLGGTKIKAGIMDEQGNLLRKLDMRTPIELGRAGILAALEQLIQSLRNETGARIEAVGIGSAGQIDRCRGTVTFATELLPGWTGTNIKELLQQACGIPVFVENDAKTAALGERWLGAVRDLAHYMFLTLGTGIGGAMIHEGKLLTTPSGGAGNVGHMVLHAQGFSCNCGGRGCFEQYASGTALDASANRIDPRWDSRVLMEKLSVKDERAEHVILRFADDLSAGLVSLHNIYEPQVFVLGGGVMDSYPLWKPYLESSIRKRTRHPIIIVPASLGNDAGMIGAARLAFDEMAL